METGWKTLAQLLDKKGSQELRNWLSRGISSIVLNVPQGSTTVDFKRSVHSWADAITIDPTDSAVSCEIAASCAASKLSLKASSTLNVTTILFAT